MFTFCLVTFTILLLMYITAQYMIYLYIYTIIDQPVKDVYRWIKRNKQKNVTESKNIWNL